jgi:hypothetical protein
MNGTCPFIYKDADMTPPSHGMIYGVCNSDNATPEKHNHITIIKYIRCSCTSSLKIQLTPTLVEDNHILHTNTCIICFIGEQCMRTRKRMSTCELVSLNLYKSTYVLVIKFAALVVSIDLIKCHGFSSLNCQQASATGSLRKPKLKATNFMQQKLQNSTTFGQL